VRDSGALKMRAGTVLRLAETREAHDILEGTFLRPSGKIALRVSK
jgi:hypothetical protein